VRVIDAMQITPLSKEHEEATRRIYNHYVLYSNATPERFERSPDVHAHALADFLSAYVAIDDNEVIGFAFAKPYAKGLESFDPAVELGVYLDEEAMGKGVASLLIQQILGDMKTLGKHTAIAKIDAENLASIRLFGKFNFVEAARLQEIGLKNGKRVTVVYMQAMLQQ
jgi:L-amino acid N-acyltransferase YncA